MITFAQLQTITNGKLISFFHDTVITELVIDSRKATTTEGSLFFAIKGERNDGHKHIKDLYDKGIRQFVVEHEPDYSLDDANIILVKSSVEALQSIAAHHRASFKIPVIGITGSNGKTIIKEWLYQLLSKDYNIVKNPGSYNSQVGVPLSVWQIQEHHQLGIFEAGISKPGEMEKLENVIRPTIGLFTNIGTAHDEGFKTQTSKIHEKLKLFNRADVIIFCNDHHELNRELKASSIKTLSWGFTADADIHITKTERNYVLMFKGKELTLQLPYTDHASIENTFHCVAIMLHLGFNTADIEARINLVRAIPMRLELKEGINHCQVIDDTYNNDWGGLKISLDFLSSQQQKKRKTLILSDILQSGLSDETLVKTIAEVVNKFNIQKFIGIGNSLFTFQTYFKSAASFHKDTDDFLAHFEADNFQDEVILIKGARAFQFEKIVTRLQKKVHGTVMEIDLGAMVSNFNFFKSRLKPQTKIMVMVKAFAYGSGSNEVAGLLQYHKADYLGVAYADEGVELRKNNITLPIMVMNPSPESFHSIMAYNLEPELYSFKILHAFIDYLKGKPCKVHIKLDTGMHRLGFEESSLPELTKILLDNKHLHVASIFSHLSGADDAEHDVFSRQQATVFLKCAQQISVALGYTPLLHILNSPGILRLSDLQLDMVRLGIGLYGVDPTSKGNYPLKPAATLKTIVSQVKQIQAGETVGYGRRGIAEKPITIATIAIGYADGFSRAFSRGIGEVLINKKRAKVIGNVCMDMTMVDVTGLNVNEGDEVVIFGPDLPIEELASKINTIPYEILTSTSERVKRVFVAESI